MENGQTAFPPQLSSFKRLADKQAALQAIEVPTIQRVVRLMVERLRLACPRLQMGLIDVRTDGRFSGSWAWEVVKETGSETVWVSSCGM